MIDSLQERSGFVRKAIVDMTLSYTIVLTEEPDQSAINVRVPALPGVFTWGKNEAEAIAAAREAVALHLEGFLERGMPYPPDSKPRATLGSSSRVVLTRIEVEQLVGA